MRNNNQEIIRLLALESYRENRGRNRILIGAVAFVVIMLFGVFSLSIGKIEADYLLYIYEKCRYGSLYDLGAADRKTNRYD